jgi:hypothetical protein
MKLALTIPLLLSTVLLGACNKPVEVIPPVIQQPVAVPGPAGPQGEAGAAGKQGEAGKAGTDTTVIVVPVPAASAPSN